MKKRSPRVYLGLFFLVFFAIFFFGAGTGGIVDFIRTDQSNTISTEIGVLFLVAVAFIAAYFVGVFAFPPLHSTSGWARTVAIIWGLGMLLISLYWMIYEPPIHHLLRAIVHYSWAGMMLAGTSNRFRATIKI